jgi:protein tyrosine phosphatase (PTP) superfamily phosphohydrolase (DUF442 family)
VAGKSWQMSSLEEITNYFEITPEIHTAGQPSVAQLSLLKPAGIELVINLATDSSPNAILDEQERVERFGMEYISIPVVWEHPTTADLEQFFAVMRKHPNKVKFIHCVMNMRVSAFTYLYRVNALNEPQDDAWQDVLEVWQPEGIWADFIQEHRLTTGTSQVL